MIDIASILCQESMKCNVIKFGKNLRNKSDSRSCLFNPRLLLSSVGLLDLVGREMASRLDGQGEIDAVVGVATSGIPWATACSMFASKPLLFVRSDRKRYQQLIEGRVVPGTRVTLVDDLIFHGTSKSKCIDILTSSGLIVSSVLVVIDRQLERKSDGPGLAVKYGVPLETLVTMQEIVEYLESSGSITEHQMRDLVTDYLGYERIRMPEFALRHNG